MMFMGGDLDIESSSLVMIEDSLKLNSRQNAS